MPCASAHTTKKAVNYFYVRADVKKEKRKEYYCYNKVLMLQQFSFDKLLEALKKGFVLVDFDA